MQTFEGHRSTDDCSLCSLSTKIYMYIYFTGSKLYSMWEAGLLTYVCIVELPMKLKSILT